MFVGRGKELGRIADILSREEPVRFLYVSGPAGIGKTYLLHEITRKCGNSGYVCSGVMDLSETTYRDSLRLLNEIAAQLGVGYFETFTALAREYLMAHGEKRASLVREVREAFFQGYEFASSDRKVALVLDTLDAIRHSDIERSLLPSLVESTGAGSLLIVAGREELDPTKSPFLASTEECVRLSGFTLEETRMLAKIRFGQQGVPALAEKSIRRLHHLAGRKPFIIDLALDAIRHTGNEEDILQAAGEEFERKIVVWVRDLGELEHRALVQAAILDRRFNAEVMAHLNDMELARCSEVLESLRRFSFVRIAEPGSDLNLHDEMRFFVGEFLDVSTWLKTRLYSGALAYYRNNLEPSVASREAQYARLERIHYQLLLDLEVGFRQWDQAFEQALESFDVDYCRSLLYEIIEHRPHLDALEQHKVDLLEGELCLAEYRPLEARPKFEYLMTALTPENEPEMLIRSLRGLGQCALNACTIDVASLSHMVEHWRKGIALAQELEGKISCQLVASLLENLGSTYQLLGMHELAEEYYSQALGLYRKNELARGSADVLDKMGLLYREQYSSKEALECLEQSLQVREAMQDARGTANTCSLLALVKGDRWGVGEEEHFHEALALLEEVNDPSALASVYGRLAWYKFITRDLAPSNLGEAEQYARKSIAISKEGGFGRGLSKDYHTLFHVIELKEGVEAAEPYLRKCYDCAHRFADVFFVYDALAHMARLDYQRGEYGKIPEYVSEIEEYESRGAQITVFKGRILSLLGHVALENGSLDDAARHYDRGWRIVIERRTASTVPSLKDELEGFGSELLELPCPGGDKVLVCERLVDLWQGETDEQLWSEPINTLHRIIAEAV